MLKIARSFWFKVSTVAAVAAMLALGRWILAETKIAHGQVAAAPADDVQEAGTVEEVVFRHAKHISQKDLDEMTASVKKGLPMNPAANKEAARAIQDYLKYQKGRYWANVMLEVGAEPTDRRVVFNISEGPVLRVRSTQFVGGESLAGPARLRTQIKTSRAILGMGAKYDDPT